MVPRNSILIVLWLFTAQYLFGCDNKQSLPTFSFFKQLSQDLPEFPPCDDTNWIDPDYTSFLQTLRVGYIENLLLLSGIKDKSKSIPYVLNNLLDKLLMCNTQNAEKYNATLLCVKEEAKLFVWGDLHGSFHSLVRDVDYLIQEGVIDEQLIIKQKDCFFVLLGDAIDRGPYSMATLCLILTLCYQNPSFCFYIKGNHEAFKYWENFGLKRELQVIAQHVRPKISIIKEKINMFFNSLKEYLLVCTQEDVNATILFSFHGMKDPYVNVSLPLHNRPGMHAAMLSFEKFCTEKTYLIPEVLFKTEDWREEHRARNGLGLLDQCYGATTWSVLSSPIKIHEDFYGFDCDAVALIKMGNSVRTSSVQVINRHKQDTHFSKQEPYNIVTGRLLSHPQAAPVGKDIVFGSTMPLSQGLPVISKRTRRGVNLAILEQNQKGGIAGRHIKFDVRDDYYAPLHASKNIRDFVSRGIDLILFPVGSATLKSYTDLMMNNDIAVLFPMTGNADFGNSLLKGIVNLTAMNIEEITAHINFLTQNQAVKNFAFLFQEDEYGRETLDTAHRLLKEKGITKWLDLPYVRGTVDFNPQIAKLRKSNIDALGLLCTADAAQEFIRKIDLEFLHNKTLFGLSTLGSIAFKNFIDKKGIHFYFSSRVPDPTSSMLPIAKEYRLLMDRDYYKYDNASFEGYIGTHFLLDIMEKMTGPINKNTLVAEMEKVNHMDLQGLTLTYKPTDRSFNMSVWLEEPNDEKWIEIPDPVK